MKCFDPKTEFLYYMKASISSGTLNTDFLFPIFFLKGKCPVLNEEIPVNKY